MSVYKPFTTSDVIVTPFKVNKSFSFQGASAITASNVGIDRFVGKNIPFVSGSNTTGQIKTQYKSSVYNSIKQLYYTNFLRGEDGSPVFTSSIGIDGVRTGQGATDQPSYENYLPNTLDANRFFPTGSNDVIGVMSIPSNLFGEYIKPGTFSYTNTITTYTDDSEGGLISGSTKVGDIIYKHGMAIMTANNLAHTNRFALDSNITCSFQSTMTIYESQYKCTFNPNEYNYTQNPSALTNKTDGVAHDFLTGSYFQPYITTVGLYNNSNQLIAVGKLSQPLQSSNVTDTTILVNLDL
jgi:hypothetical protein